MRGEEAGRKRGGDFEDGEGEGEGEAGREKGRRGKRGGAVWEVLGGFGSGASGGRR